VEECFNIHPIKDIYHQCEFFPFAGAGIYYLKRLFEEFIY